MPVLSSGTAQRTGRRANPVVPSGACSRNCDRSGGLSGCSGTTLPESHSRVGCFRLPTSLTRSGARWDNQRHGQDRFLDNPVSPIGAGCAAVAADVLPGERKRRLHVSGSKPYLLRSVPRNQQAGFSGPMSGLRRTSAHRRARESHDDSGARFADREGSSRHSLRSKRWIDLDNLLHTFGRSAGRSDQDSLLHLARMNRFGHATRSLVFEPRQRR
jgi:hypothetical protein